MIRMRMWIVCGVFLVIGPVVSAAEPATKDAGTQALAAKIDRHIEVGWDKAKVTPAAKSSDAEFVRRVYLDLVGRIPTVAEVRSFLKDQSPNKREKLVDQLLANP